MVNKILTLVAVFMALALLLVPTTSFGADGPRPCSSKRYGENAVCDQIDGAIPFRAYAKYLAKEYGMEFDEFIALNKWEPFVDTIKTDPNMVYLVLLTEEPVTIASR